MAVVFSQRSRWDLLEILEFHTARNPRYAKELTDRLIDVALSLGEHPQRGSQSRHREHRRVFESGHAIVYDENGGDFVVLRILHGARDIEALLSDEN
ncbi:type II toxin-antitoxin system RelE/ParE family toxin [Methylopila sp. M107]|uniref:type II toxin-antitoxin system RelE/ParE family toxin n=1 Tax=Methylopila sp. M107 TaxID=1101190 RepID=UPI00037F6EE6|nr:type II toxin-antitoxin system RelE/ParE family toxin [Methylopila sp. M107]